jgi:BirA family biotin operon repressor/biotin-[acetyl-CoA-carboxylase] ligase
MTELSLRVLRHLADGEYHSGAALARALDVTRGTIWNAVRVLDAAGLDVQRTRGRGYRLSRGLSMLERDAILRHAGKAAARLSVEICGVVDSTNTVLVQRAAIGAPTGSVLAAELQSSGRGRMGRAWHANIGGALTFSLLWRFVQGASGLGGLSLAAGVALMRALAQLGAKDPQLKWPNDIVWHGRKVAGMLVEMQGDALGPSTVVIGIGLNIRLSDVLEKRIDQPVTDLETVCSRELDRNAVLGAILGQLVPALEQFAERGFAPMREEWERYHAHQGREVTVRLPSGDTQTGVARGVADDGALLFESGKAVRRLHSGEISLRAGAQALRSTRVRSRA